MRCRLLTESDVAAAPDWAVAGDLRPDRWRDGSTRAAAGLDGDELVAVGRIFTGPVHPGRYWTEVVVDPGRRRRGHGRQLVAYLAGLRADPRPLCTRGHSSSDAVLFARSLGARPYQTCPPQRVVPADAAALSAGGPATRPGSAVGWAELRRAWTDVYAWVHAGWSPVAPGCEEAVLAGFVEDLDLAHTRVAGGTTVRAAAFVFADGPEPVLVAECRTPEEPAGLDLLRACVRDSLLSLAADGVTAASFDGHDTDPHYRPLLGELPTTGEAFELLELAWPADQPSGRPS